ncbi:MAG: hypothetical protein ACYDD0_11715 [Candidatus Dormibacteria bacterium]
MPLNVDLDVVLADLAHTVCSALRRRLPGYPTATHDTLRRRFLSAGGLILNHGSEIIVRLDPSTYSPVLRRPTFLRSQCRGGTVAVSASSTPDRDPLGANSLCENRRRPTRLKLAT